MLKPGMSEYPEYQDYQKLPVKEDMDLQNVWISLLTFFGMLQMKNNNNFEKVIGKAMQNQRINFHCFSALLDYFL